jgi:hypothetical protein
MIRTGFRLISLLPMFTFSQCVLGPLCVGACAVIFRFFANPGFGCYREIRVTIIYSAYHVSLSAPKIWKQLWVSSWVWPVRARPNINLDLVRKTRVRLRWISLSPMAALKPVQPYVLPVCAIINGSVGTPAHGYQVKIIDDQGWAVRAGDIAS